LGLPFSYYRFGGDRLSEEQKRGQFTVEHKKKKREIFEEQGHRVDVPPDVSDEKKKAYAESSEDATAGWG
jgi:hypothetical protein